MATVTRPLRLDPADHDRTMTLDQFEDAEFIGGYRIVDPLEKWLTVLSLVLSGFIPRVSDLRDAIEETEEQIP